MIEISKAEKDIIRKQCPNVHIARTLKQRSNRGYYYCEENREVKKILRELRKGVCNR